MSSVRSTSDGRGPVTRTRVPDRDEQGKPSKDARRAVVIPLKLVYTPVDATVTAIRNYQVPSTEGEGYCVKGGCREGEERVTRSVNPIPNPDPNPTQARQMSFWYFGSCVTAVTGSLSGPRKLFKGVTTV